MPGKTHERNISTIPVPNQIFAFQKILIKFNIQIYWNLAIFPLKLSNDLPNVWHLCQRCVENVPTLLQFAGSRHLRMRRCENYYFILINIAGQWQDSDFICTCIHESFHEKEERYSGVGGESVWGVIERGWITVRVSLCEFPDSNYHSITGTKSSKLYRIGYK